MDGWPPRANSSSTTASTCWSAGLRAAERLVGAGCAGRLVDGRQRVGFALFGLGLGRGLVLSGLGRLAFLAGQRRSRGSRRGVAGIAVQVELDGVGHVGAIVRTGEGRGLGPD